MTDPIIENVTYAELSVGRSASLSRTLSRQDIELFAAVSGDVNPEHLDPAYAKNDIFHSVIGHGMWSGGLISAVLGTVLPGPGTIYLEQDMAFRNPVRVGDRVTATVTVAAIRPDKPIVTFDCRCVSDKGDVIIEGKAVVKAPTEKIRVRRPDVPDVEIHRHDHTRDLIESCRALPPLKTAVVHPVEAHVIEAVALAAKEGLIDPVLIGPKRKIEQAARDAGVDIGQWPVTDVEHSHEAAARAVAMTGQNLAGAIMKGSLHTDELLAAIVPASSGLRTEWRMSHAYLMDSMSYPKPLIVTDAAINIAPDLDAKADICRNAINLWRALYGTERKPKLALLAAVETVNPKMQATLDAAALCKMAERGQIEGGIFDGPLAFDNAVSSRAAADKGIVSDVAGDADILVVPNIEAGNMLAKEMSFIGHADAAGIVLGARVPIILTSRADSVQARLTSCALAVRLAQARTEGAIK